MACVPTGAMDELGFAQALALRDQQIGQCRGQLIRMTFWSYKIFVLEQILDAEAASDVLWQGFVGDTTDGITFELCCAHWFDLAVLTELRAVQYQREDWFEASSRLFESLCSLVGWDAKELVNMVAWSRERLT